MAADAPAPDLRARLMPRLRSGVRLPPQEPDWRAEQRRRHRAEAIRLYAVLYALALTGIVVILAMGGLGAH